MKKLAKHLKEVWYLKKYLIAILPVVYIFTLLLILFMIILLGGE